MREKYLILLLLILILGSVGGAAAAIGTGFTETVKVSYGEVDYQQSDLYVEDYEVKGPGINVDSIDVTINNTVQDSKTADVSVYFMSGNSVISEANVSGESWSSDQEKTINMNLNSSVKEKNYDSIDVEIEEQ